MRTHALIAWPIGLAGLAALLALNDGAAFRHPRIDFEQPQAVCAVLAAARREIAG
jgi:hypothetical protein